MPRFLSLMAGALLLLWTSPASANWLKGCQTGGSLTRSLSPGEVTCHRDDGVVTADDDPDILQVTECDQVDIFYYPDRDGDGVDSAGTVDVYTCPMTGNAVLDTEAERLAACQPFDGGTTLDAANTEVEGLGAANVWFDVEGWDDDTELVVKCNVGPSH